jgi:hypothetical protein
MARVINLMKHPTRTLAVVRSLAVVTLFADCALGADKLKDAQLDKVVLAPSPPQLSMQCLHSDCLPPIWDASYAWMLMVEWPNGPWPNGPPKIVSATGTGN